MGRGQRLLREPPEAFTSAMIHLHQDAFVIHPTLEAIADETASGVQGANGVSLLAFLDAVLDDESVVNADLRGLIDRQKFVEVRLSSQMARQFLERMRETLRGRLEPRV